MIINNNLRAINAISLKRQNCCNVIYNNNSVAICIIRNLILIFKMCIFTLSIQKNHFQNNTIFNILYGVILYDAFSFCNFKYIKLLLKEKKVIINSSISHIQNLVTNLKYKKKSIHNMLDCSYDYTQIESISFYNNVTNNTIEGMLIEIKKPVRYYSYILIVFLIHIQNT